MHYILVLTFCGALPLLDYVSGYGPDTYTIPRNEFVIPKCRLNNIINAVHFASIKLNTKLKLIKNIKLFITKLKISYIDPNYYFNFY